MPLPDTILKGTITQYQIPQYYTCHMCGHKHKDMSKTRCTKCKRVMFEAAQADPERVLRG